MDDSQLYGESYFKEHGYGLDSKRELEYIKDRNKIAARATGNKILDIGCGLGAFLDTFSNQWDKYGYEVSNYASKVCTTKGIAMYPGLETIKDNSFDVIVFRGTLQHISTPIEDLQQAIRILKPSGLLAILATPNTDSLGYRSILYNGIDRVNNTKGYELDNCVPCCFRCNWAKGDLTSEQFKAHIKRQYLHLFKKVTDKTPGELIDALVTADMKTWFAQEDALNDSLSESKRVEATERIHLYNNKRNKLMRSIDFLLDFSEDTVTEKTYNNFVEAKEKEGLK